MALDKVGLLVNKIRRLNSLNENGKYDSELDDLYEELGEEIEVSNISVKVVVKIEKEIKLNEVDCWEEWLIDELIDDNYSSSPEDLLVKDIVEAELDSYIDTKEEADITVYNKNGKKIYHREGRVY